MLQFGDTIRKKREEKGWTQKQLAQKLFVSDKAISRWENNQSYPDITLLLEIAKVLELDYQELIEGNQYILKKQRKTRNTILTIVLVVFIVVGIGLIDAFYKQSKEKITEHGLDFLVSKKWKEIGFSTEEGYAMFGYISDYQKESILEFFDVDHLVKVENHSNRGIDYYFGINANGHHQSFQVYYRDENYYIYVPTFYENYEIGVTYLCKKDISDFQNFYQSLPKYDYDLHHEIECLSPLKRVEGQTLVEATQYASPMNSNGFGIGTSSIGWEGKHYFCLFSETVDLQTIRFEEGVLYLTGESRKYNKIYFMAFELERVHTLIYNDEVVYDYSELN